VKSLERTVGLVGVIGISISSMMGSGVFVLPGIGATATGSSVSLAFLVAALCVLPAALSKAELATAMPTSGGTYVYIDRAVGPLWGTIAGLGLTAASLFKSAFALMGFGEYLKVTVAAIQGTQSVNFNTTPYALGCLAFIVLLNIFGVRKVSKVQTVVVGIALLCFGVVISVAAKNFPAEQSALKETSFFAGGIVGFAETVGLLFVGFAGVTKIAAIAEEVKDPARNLPRGMLLSLFGVTAIYFAMSFTLAGTLPIEQLEGNQTALYTLTKVLLGREMSIIMGVLGAMTMTAMAMAGVLATSRFPFAMSRDRLLPSFLSEVHPQYGTPVYGIIFIGISMATVILTVDIVVVAKIASAVKIMLFLAVNLIVIILREGKVQWYQPSYRTPFYPAAQIFGIVVSFALLILLGAKVPIAIAGITIPGMLVYFLYSRKRVERRGVFGILGKRKDLIIARPTVMDLETMNLEGKHAAVVVPLLGEEHSPEALAEVGATLAGSRTVEVLHVTDVPDQVSLSAVALEDSVEVSALQRRIGAMSQTKDATLHVSPVVTRDVVQTVHDSTKSLECEWVVMAWQGKTSNRFGILSPLGWLADHLSCNLALYKDAGVRYIRHILVYAEPGPDDALVVSTSDLLAKEYNAELTFVRFVSDDQDAPELQSEGDYLDQIRAMCTVNTRSLILRGDSEIEAIAGATAAYDLLVLGAPPDTSFTKRLLGTDRDKLTEQATCSVLRLKTSKVSTKHPSLIQQITPPEDPHGILHFIDDSCAQARIKITKKEALFNHIAQSFSRSHPKLEIAAVEKALWEREKAQNTSIGLGIALPHATLADAEETLLGVFTTETPIDYNSPDGSKIDLFFVTIGPPRARQTHLVLLSTLSRMIVSEGFAQAIRSSENSTELLEVLGRTSISEDAPKKKLRREGSGRALKSKTLPPNLRQRLDARIIHAHLDVETKGELFDRISQLIADDLQTDNAIELLDSFHEHELEHNTGIGLGAAVPRATLSDIGNTCLGIFTTKKPIQYGSPDSVPVDVFFTTVGPLSQQRLQLNVLTAVVQLVSTTSSLSLLREADTHDELLEAFEQAIKELTREN